MKKPIQVIVKKLEKRISVLQKAIKEAKRNGKDTGVLIGKKDKTTEILGIILENNS